MHVRHSASARSARSLGRAAPYTRARPRRRMRVALNVLKHGVDLLRVLRFLALDLFQTLLLRVDLRLQSAGAVRLLGHLHAQARDAVGAVLQVRAHDSRGALALGGGALRLGDLLARALGLQILLAHFLRDVLRRCIELLELALRAGKVFLRGLIVVVHGLGLRVQPGRASPSRRRPRRS